MDTLLLSNMLQILTALGVLVALVCNLVSLKDRGKETATTTAEMRMDIKHIRESLQRLDASFEDIPERVRAVEESAKQAHHRINNLEGRIK